MAPLTESSLVLPFPEAPDEAAPFNLSESRSHSFATADAEVSVVSAEVLKNIPEWKECFGHLRRDHRYFELIERTLDNEFDYFYLVLQNRQTGIRAVQPCFMLDQDIVEGAGTWMRSLVGVARRWVPGFLKIRTLMVGCAAGEGHFCSGVNSGWIAKTLGDALPGLGLKMKASLIVMKEFPAMYRETMGCLAANGFTRIPSMPMVQLALPFASFEQYMEKKLSKVTRKSLRRKFKKLEGSSIQLEVLTDVTGCVDELHALYMQVFDRAKLTFEKLSKEYLVQLGRDMPDRVRFFIWRQEGRAIAFSLCFVHGDAIYDEYIGLQYPLALDLHVYFLTLKDIIEWGIANGCETYYSSALSYDPKLHLKCELAPLDLYVRHTSNAFNRVFRHILPWMEPTHNDPLIRKFPNACEL